MNKRQLRLEEEGVAREHALTEKLMAAFVTEKEDAVRETEIKMASYIQVLDSLFSESCLTLKTRPCGLLPRSSSPFLCM